MERLQKGYTVSDHTARHPFVSSRPTPHTLALPAAHQTMSLGTKTSVGTIGIDAVTPNAGRREVTFINVCGDQGLENLRGVDPIYTAWSYQSSLL